MNRSAPPTSGCKPRSAAETELAGKCRPPFRAGPGRWHNPSPIEAAGRADQCDDQRNMAVVIEHRCREGADAGNRLADRTRQLAFADFLQRRLHRPSQSRRSPTICRKASGCIDSSTKRSTIFAGMKAPNTSPWRSSATLPCRRAGSCGSGGWIPQGGSRSARHCPDTAPPCDAPLLQFERRRHAQPHRIELAQAGQPMRSASGQGRSGRIPGPAPPARACCS